MWTCITVDSSQLSLKADVEGTNFAYDYRVQLAYVMTFDHPHADNFHLRHPCVVQMSWVLFTQNDLSWSHDEC